MVLSNVIVDVTILRRSFVFGQSRAKGSAGFTNVRRHKDNTDTGRPQTSVLWREIAVHQYSTSTGSRLYLERY